MLFPALERHCFVDVTYIRVMTSKVAHNVESRKTICYGLNHTIG